MSINAIVYPASRDITPLFRYKNLLPGYDNLIPVSPNGSGYKDLDVGRLDKGKEIGITIETDFSVYLDKCEECIFTVYSEDVLNKIYLCIEKKKNVTCLFCFPESQIEMELLKKCDAQNIIYKNYTKNHDNNLVSFTQKNEKILSEITTPIILICGMSENTQKFHIQLEIRKNLLKMGYKVSQIGTKEYSRFFSIHNFPAYMLSVHDETDKVYYFNHYIKQIELQEKPDIIVLGIPGGIIPFDYEHPNRFGILCYLVSSAVSIDYTIASLVFNDYDKSFFEFFKNYTKYRYGFETAKLHLSNVYHDIYGDERLESERLVLMNEKAVGTKIQGLTEGGIFSVFDNNGTKGVIDDIIKYLTD